MDHDERCAAQDEALKIVRERTHGLANENLVAHGDIIRLKDDAKDAQDRLRTLMTDQHDHDLSIGRVEAELRALVARVPVTLAADLATLGVQLHMLTLDVNALKALIKVDFIHRSEFDPVKRVVYGVVGLILTAVIVALVALVVKR